jgi:hypothetical protein
VRARSASWAARRASHPIRVSAIHPPGADDAAMQGKPPSYEIRVAGRLGATILTAFPDLQGEEHGSETVLTGEVRDRAALYGILARLDALGLELIEIKRTTAAPTVSSLTDGPETGTVC